jgi:hypothetical protein
MADKKISELPLINEISGSIVFVPIVHDGITEKITVEDFSKFTNKYAAQTGSVNVFTANQTINANLSVNGNTTISSNATVGGNLVVNGKLTAQEVHTEITSASIIFESGSTIFGNSGDDTHQFTGVVSINGVSIGAGVINEFTASQLENDIRMLYITGALNAFTASQIGKDGTLAEVTSSLRFFYQTTSSLHAFTASQIGKDETLKVVTSSLNAFTASQIGKDGTLAEVTSSLRFFYQTTSSLHAFTASQIDKDGTLALVTSSLNDFTQSQIGKDETLKVVTSSLNAFTASQIGKDFTLSIVTSSLNNYTSSVIGQANTIAVFTSSINAFTGSQIGKDGTLAEVTSSLRFFYQTTSSLHAFTASQIGKDFTLSIVTSSIDAHILKQATQTGSQESINTTISIVTGSMRAEIGGIEAYTASLKSAIVVNGNNVRIIGELTASRIYTEFITSSVLFVTGSNIIGDQSTDKHEFTGSVHINDTLFIKGISQGTGELNAFTGSQIGKDFTLSVVTSSIDAHILKQATQTGSQDLVNLGISTYTGSQNVINSSVDAHILKQATQTGSQDIVNFNISVVTSSIDSHILKQSTQTGSQDMVNYNISVYTGSQNVINTSVNSHILAQSTQTGSQDLVNLGISTFTGSLRSEVNLIEAYTASLKGAAIVSSSQQITNYYKFAETASANTFYGTQTITGSLNVGVGTSDNTVGDLFVDTANKTVYVGRQSSTSGDNTIFAIRNRLNTNNALYVDPGGTGVVQMTGSLEVTRGVKFGTATGNVEVVGNLVIGTSGNGIDFSANTGGAGKSSQLLDDYEEGTITGTITCGTSGTVTLDAGYNTLSYTKIGGVVHVFGNLSVTSVSSPVGYFTIPLPFACVNLGDSAGTTVANIVVNGTNTANTSDFVGWIDETQSNVIVRLGNATGVQNTSANELKALTDIYLQVTYRTT